MSDAPRTNPDLHERVAEVINQIRPHLQGVASGDLRGHDGHHLADACLDKARHGVDVKTMRQVSQAPLAGDLRGGSQVLAHDYRNRRLAKREPGGKHLEYVGQGARPYSRSNAVGIGNFGGD